MIISSQPRDMKCFLKEDPKCINHKVKKYTDGFYYVKVKDFLL